MQPGGISALHLLMMLVFSPLRPPFRLFPSFLLPTITVSRRQPPANGPAMPIIERSNGTKHLQWLYRVPVAALTLSRPTSTPAPAPAPTAFHQARNRGSESIQLGPRPYCATVHTTTNCRDQLTGSTARSPCAAFFDFLSFSFIMPLQFTAPTAFRATVGTQGRLLLRLVIAALICVLVLFVASRTGQTSRL